MCKMQHTMTKSQWSYIIYHQFWPFPKHPFVNPFPNDKFWTIPNWKCYADNNFKFDENGRKFSKRVENNMGKRETACYKQFLLFLQCFSKDL